jgi:hypothetical protein
LRHRRASTCQIIARLLHLRQQRLDDGVAAHTRLLRRHVFVLRGGGRAKEERVLL